MADALVDRLPLRQPGSVPICRHHRLVRDLAALDRDAAVDCSREDQLRFLPAFLGLPGLDCSARQLLREAFQIPHRRVR